MRAFCFGIIALLLTTETVLASNITVRPFLFDETVVGRDVVTRDVTIQNKAGNKITVYATVNEITLGNDGEILEFTSPVMTDRTNSVTSWIEVTRGRIEINAGEEVTVPVTFKIHPNPKPGVYHAFIGFSATAKRFEAEENALRGNVDGVVVKLAIADKSIESLRVTSFLIDRFILTDSNRTVSIAVENLGDVPAIPSGEVIFYNKSGVELASVPVNDNKVLVAPGEKTTMRVAIPLENHLGRFKANLDLQYGEKQRATLYDTAQFFMLPLPYLIALMISFILLVFVLFWLLHRSLSHRHAHGHDEHDVPLFVRSSHEPNPKDHDIDLSKK